MPANPSTLPIHSIRQQILVALREGNRLVISAPTGSGKTTQVPQFLMQSGQFHGQILILQPRRLAARLVAQRVAGEVGCPLGDRVGYQTRHDSRVSDRTVIRFLTEGLFLRQLQSNPTLTGVSAVILDEFHERNLATDASIALVKLLQESARPDLRMIVMSATLDIDLVTGYLACPSLEAHGRAFPVDIDYLAGRSTAGKKTTQRWESRREAAPWDQAADALADLLDEHPVGDVLIFMPGAYEIRRTIETCQRLATPAEPLAIFPLYSELTAPEQDAALSPCSDRKIIVSTNVAETSITIEGIHHVIDSGLARIHRFDPRRGINVLMVEPISQASADQRAGRAGRTAAGTCTRLWAETEHRHRPPHSTPEIQRLDLAEVVLQLHAMGVGDVSTFPWLQPPAPEALTQAQRTLRMLAAIDESIADPRRTGMSARPAIAPGANPLTPLGRQMALLPMHPRLSRMLIEADQRGCLQRAALWATFISERDILLRGAEHHFAEDLPDEFPRSDFLILERAMELARKLNFEPGRCGEKGISSAAAREVEKTCRLYLDASRAAVAGGSRRQTPSLADLAKSLLVAFPDHLAIRRSDKNLAAMLVGNRKGQLDPDTVARHLGPLLPLEIREVGAGPRNQEARTVLSLVTEIDPAWLAELHPELIHTERDTYYNPVTQAIESADRELFLDLPIGQSPREDVDPSKAAELLAEQIIRGQLKLERWDLSVEQWIQRARCAAQWFPERRLITYTDEERRLVIEEICAGATRYKQVMDRPCLPAVKSALSWDDQQFIEKMAPERIELPRGWRMKIEYHEGLAPRGRAKIQDLYGLLHSPNIAAGRAKLLLEILAPNMRPIQVTDDLANFWKNLYPSLKKELARRYPRHEWR